MQTLTPRSSTADSPGPAPARAPRAGLHTINPERARFYDLQWGDTEGFAYVAAGLPAADILARGWPLGEGEAPSNPGELGDKMVMLLWSRTTADAFKAAGRPHTGKVFAWPAEARALDRYVERLAREYENVFVRKYLADTEADAKRGNPPTLAQVVQVEDAPADAEGLAPAYSYTVQTSEQKRQGYYRFPRPLPWHTVQALAEATTLRLAPLGADSGGPNPAQFCRVPTTRNTKERAGRFRVHLVEGAGDVLPAELARAVGVDLARSTADKSQLSVPKTDRTNPADWADLPDGAALMASARYQALFARRPQLAALAMGQRVTIQTKRGPDDTGNQQVALLVSNLLTIGRKNAAGEFVAGLGAPPLAEIRALALYWRDALRPGYDLAAYKADVDRLIAKYIPPGYAPEATRCLGAAAEAPPLAELPPAQHKRPGRPAGQRASNAERLVELLAAHVGETVTRSALAEALGLRVRMIAYLLADLGDRVELQRVRHGLRVVRCAINPPAPDVQSLDAEDVAEGAATPQIADVQLLESTHPPLLPACPAPDAAGDAGPLDLAELVAEWVAAYGHRWRAVKAAAAHELGDGCDLAELRRAFELHPWRAYRAELRSLADAALLQRCKSAARSYQRAVAQSDPRQGWYEARLAMCEEERRRRGLDVLTGKRRRKGEAFGARTAAAAATAQRLAEQARRLGNADDAPRQAELWRLADQHRPEPPATHRPRITLGDRARPKPAAAGCVPPPAELAAYPRPSPWVDRQPGLVERLRALGQRQEVHRAA